MKVEYDWENKKVRFYRVEGKSFTGEFSKKDSLLEEVKGLKFYENYAQGELSKSIDGVTYLFNRILEEDFPIVNYCFEKLSPFNGFFHIPATNIKEYEEASSIVDAIDKLNKDYSKAKIDFKNNQKNISNFEKSLDMLFYPDAKFLEFNYDYIEKMKNKENRKQLSAFLKYQGDLSSEFIKFRDFLEDLDSKHNFISDDQNRKNFRTDETLFLEALLKKDKRVI